MVRVDGAASVTRRLAAAQVNFFDDTEVLLWADRRWVTFKGKSKARRTYDLADVTSVPDLAKRIKVRPRSSPAQAHASWHVATSVAPLQLRSSIVTCSSTVVCSARVHRGAEVFLTLALPAVHQGHSQPARLPRVNKPTSTSEGRIPSKEGVEEALLLLKGLSPPSASQGSPCQQPQFIFSQASHTTHELGAFSLPRPLASPAQDGSLEQLGERKRRN